MEPDRAWLTEEYLPKLTGRVLYVGVNHYTSRYKFLTQADTFETLDSCPDRAQYGQMFSDIHHIEEILKFNQTDQYDHISVHGCHGYEGHNIDNSRIYDELYHLSAMVKIGGTLQFGPGVHWLPEYDEVHWQFFLQKFPFYQYDRIYEGVVSPNYIFWGKKMLIG